MRTTLTYKNNRNQEAAKPQTAPQLRQRQRILAAVWKYLPQQSMGMALSDTLSLYDGYRFPPFADIKYSHMNAAHPVFRCLASDILFFYNILLFLASGRRERRQHSLTQPPY
jgi:hypothetical protein